MRVAFVLFLSIGFSAQAWAQYQSFPDRGLETRKFMSPQGLAEECVISKGFPGWVNSDTAKAEKSLVKLKKLCSYDVYSKAVDAVGVCPKLNSTNPGVLLFGIDGLDKDQFENSECIKGSSSEAKVLAKFKSSVSCSYTPSILGYYQLSQMFGGALKVPEAVIRTMDIDTHKEIREEAMDLLVKLGSTSKLIGKTWKDSWGKNYRNPTSRGGRRVFSADSHFVYGALSKNPRGERKYREVYGRWSSYDKRFDSLVRQLPYKNIVNAQSLEQIVGGEVSESSLQKIISNAGCV